MWCDISILKINRQKKTQQGLVQKPPNDSLCTLKKYYMKGFIYKKILYEAEPLSSVNYL